MSKSKEEILHFVERTPQYEPSREPELEEELQYFMCNTLQKISERESYDSIKESSRTIG